MNTVGSLCSLRSITGVGATGDPVKFVGRLLMASNSPGGEDGRGGGTQRAPSQGLAGPSFIHLSRSPRAVCDNEKKSWPESLFVHLGFFRTLVLANLRARRMGLSSLIHRFVGAHKSTKGSIRKAIPRRPPRSTSLQSGHTTNHRVVQEAVNVEGEKKKPTARLTRRQTH